MPATPSKRTWVLFYFHLLANKSFIHFFKVVEQLRRHCTRRKMVGMRVPLLQVFEKGTMFTLFYLFVVAYLMLSKQTPAKTSLTKISKSLPDPSQVPVVVKSEPLDESSSLRGPGVRGPGMKKGKNKPDMRFSSPIVVSSDESDAPTPKAKTAESSNNFAFENLKKAYVQRQFFFFSLSFLISDVVLLQPHVRRVRASYPCSCLAPWFFRTMLLVLMGAFYFFLVSLHASVLSSASVLRSVLLLKILLRNRLSRPRSRSISRICKFDLFVQEICIYDRVSFIVLPLF